MSDSNEISYKNGSNDSVSKLMDKQVLFKNSLWNLAGQVIPLLIALISIPIIIKYIGTERFGVLTISWTVLGYFSLFDFGLGRAVTQLVSVKIGEGKESEISGVIWTAIIMLGCCGFFGAILALILSPILINEIFKISPSIKSETLICFYIISLSIPIIVISNIFSGLLEAKQKFELVNVIRIPLGVTNFIIPLLLVPFTEKIYWFVGLLSLGRTIGLIYFIIMSVREYPILKKKANFNKSEIRHLIGIGGWMTVSNIISPIMNSLDRFLIGAVLSVAAVAYYATPYEVASKLQIFVSPLTRVLFPAFSISGNKRINESVKLLKGTTRMLFVILFPLTLTIVAFSREILNIWLGVEFSAHSFTILQILTIGTIVNILAQLPFTFIQGMGRPDLTAKNHLIEFPIYIALFYILISHYGIIGVAISWLIRVVIDATLLFWQFHTRIVSSDKYVNWKILWIIFSILIMVIFPLWDSKLIYRIVIYLFIVTAVSFVNIRYFLKMKEVEFLKNIVNLKWLKTHN